MNPATYTARSQLNLPSIVSLNYGNSRMWTGEGKELKEDLNEVTSFKGSEDFNTVIKFSSLYINIGGTSCSFIYS